MKQQYKDYSFQERQLMTRHPELAGMTSMPLDQTGLNLTVLSDFIEMCWEHDYGSEPRIHFSSGFLEWNMGKRITGRAVITKTGKLLGVFLYFERRYFQGDEARPYAIETGLSVHPGHRGQGIAQWLSLGVKQMLIERQVDFSLIWYDSRHNQPGSSFQVFARDKEKNDQGLSVRIMGRMFDFDTAVRYGQFSLFEKVALKLSTLLFPYRNGDSLPLGYTLEAFSQDRLYAYLKFLVRCQARQGGGLIPAVEDLLRWEKGAGSYDSARFYVLRGYRGGRGQVMGLYFGHKVPLDETWYYFQADGILVCPDLPEKVAKSFVRVVESKLHEGESCIGVTIAETGGGKLLWRYGYLPVENQILTMDSHALPGINLRNLKQGLVELR